MLRILIVDDEYFTIQNICQRIQWEEMNIAEVLTAEDGVFALELALQSKPDILLTDVRMPRMNGILLSTKLREIYPDLHIIFMSGYSDKEYLKSAIDLQAYGYIEKPLQMDEVQATLEKTVKHFLSERSKQQAITKLTQNYDDAFPVLRNELARTLVKSGFQFELLPSGMQSVLGTFEPHMPCFTVLIELSPTAMEFITAQDNLENILKVWLQGNELHGIFGIKETTKIIIHLFNVSEASTYAYANQLEALWMKLTTCSASPTGVQISVGTMNRGFASLSHSYDTALKARRNFFFDSELHLSFYKQNHSLVYRFEETLLDEFLHTLLTQEKEKSFLHIQHITISLKAHPDTSVKTVKGFFYKMMLQVVHAAEKFELPLYTDAEDADSILDTIYQFDTLVALEMDLRAKTQHYFELLGHKHQKHDMGFIIKSFIEANFADPELSLKKISEYCFLSEARLCVVFKEATGKTLNQYITEYRIRKAKDYLQFTNTKISDVAERVGFTDGNYFAKTFRKITGTSPSKFRENWHHA